MLNNSSPNYSDKASEMVRLGRERLLGFNKFHAGSGAFRSQSLDQLAVRDEGEELVLHLRGGGLRPPHLPSYIALVQSTDP